MEIVNRKANHEYTIIETIECGIELVGTEIKSIRKGSANFNDCYGRVKDNEVFLINMFISKYDEGSIFNHDERRERKLLLHKKEILKLNEQINQKRYTLIPLKLYGVRGKVKVLLGVCIGKKLFDKRQSLKEKDIKRKEYLRD